MKRLNKEDVFIYHITPEEEEKYIQNTEKNIARREGLAEGLAEGRAEGHEAGLAEGQKVEGENPTGRKPKVSRGRFVRHGLVRT